MEEYLEALQSPDTSVRLHAMMRATKLLRWDISFKDERLIPIMIERCLVGGDEETVVVIQMIHAYVSNNFRHESLLSNTERQSLQELRQVLCIVMDGYRDPTCLLYAFLATSYYPYDVFDVPSHIANTVVFGIMHCHPINLYSDMMERVCAVLRHPPNRPKFVQLVPHLIGMVNCKEFHMYGTKYNVVRILSYLNKDYVCKQKLEDELVKCHPGVFNPFVDIFDNNQFPCGLSLLRSLTEADRYGKTPIMYASVISQRAVEWLIYSGVRPTILDLKYALRTDMFREFILILAAFINKPNANQYDLQRALVEHISEEDLDRCEWSSILSYCIAAGINFKLTESVQRNHRLRHCARFAYNLGMKKRYFNFYMVWQKTDHPGLRALPRDLMGKIRSYVFTTVPL